MPEQIRAMQGDTLDLICWRKYGRTLGITEAVLEANPGLAALGPIIPHGYLITLPDVVSKVTQQATVNLWD